MTRRHGPAAAEEGAELLVLRSQADATGREVADTVAAIAGRLADAGDPRVWARRSLAAARARAWLAARQATGWPTGAGCPAGGRWLSLGGASAGIIVMTAATLVWKRRRRG